MDASSTLDAGPTWYIGLDDDASVPQATTEILNAAQDANYDMLTVPITTPAFQQQVEALIKSHYASNTHTSDDDQVMPLVPPLRPSDTTLHPNESIAQYIAKTSSWVDMASPDPVIANVSRQVFNTEMAYAAFCGIQNVIVDCPFLPGQAADSGGLAKFARAIAEALSVGAYLHISILLPITVEAGDDSSSKSHLSSLARQAGDSMNAADAKDSWMPWEAWNTIRTVCKYSNRVSVALKLTRSLPSDAIQNRWFSEPLRIIQIPSTSFLPNKNGQPVLFKAHKALLAKHMRLRYTPWLLLTKVGSFNRRASSTDFKASPTSGGNTNSIGLSDASFPSLADAADNKTIRSVREDPTPHLSYLRYLQRMQAPKTIIERFGAGYQDFLQAPLQPLADNLESITYEVFEKDPVKYDQYEKAIMHALLDWSSQKKPVSSTTGAVVIAVAGSGRGPLVTRALRAAESAKVAVQIWAVEKNPNAYVFLQHNNETIWGGKVTVVKSDMRAWKGPLKADGTFGSVDILVSELLGSFADNELSPECLDGVQHVLAPNHGISIPASYTAHLTPIATPRIHAEIINRAVSDPSAFEVPYVVMLHAYDNLSLTTTQALTQQEDWKNLSGEATNQPSTSGPPEVTPDVQTCWIFKHPQNPAVLAQAALRSSSGTSGGTGGSTGGDGVNEHNNRFCSLTFPCPSRGTCHGLAGYFETVLYTPTPTNPSDSFGSDPSRDPVELSINPVTIDTKSKDMISWFPIFFPLKVPVSYPDGGELVVNMWRLTDDRRVWYEWVVESFVRMGEKRLRLGVTEVHSSKKNGCLM